MAFSTVLVIAATSVQASGETFSLAPGARACYGSATPDNPRATRILLELHSEQLESQDPILWGRLFAEVKGEPLPGYVYDGCGPGAEPGTLNCSVACDGGSFTIAEAEGGDVRLNVSNDGVRLKTCGSNVEEIGAFNLAPTDLPRGGATLSPRDHSECREAMEHFEKLLEVEENAID
jgi:hypothetical protein